MYGLVHTLSLVSLYCVCSFMQEWSLMPCSWQLLCKYQLMCLHTSEVVCTCVCPLGMTRLSHWIPQLNASQGTGSLWKDMRMESVEVHNVHIVAPIHSLTAQTVALQNGIHCSCVLSLKYALCRDCNINCNFNSSCTLPIHDTRCVVELIHTRVISVPV